MPSIKNGHANNPSTKRARFQKKDYYALDMSMVEPSPTHSLQSQDIKPLQKKALDRRESIGTEYLREASTKIVYEDKLLHATMSNDMDECKKIVKTGNIDINRQDPKYGVSALHVAARMNYPQILQYFISEGADINIRCKDGPTPLHIAIRQRSEECCHILLDCLANIFLEYSDINKSLPLHIASKLGDYDMCKRLIDLDHNKETIDKIDKNKRTPLHIASSRGYTDIVNLLLDQGADWDVKERKSHYPIHLAAENGNAECCRALLRVKGEQQAKKLTKDKSTAIMLAAKSGHHKCMEILKEHNCDINSQNSSKDTALHFAAKCGYHVTVQKLIDWGAEILPNDHGNTPIHETAGQKNSKCLKILIEKGDLINLTENKAKKNVLHIATRKLSNECLSLLLELDIFRNKVNDVDNTNKTPLQIAVSKGSSECAQVLLENGADPIRKDSNNNLPLHIAASKNLKMVCLLLTKYEYRRSIKFANKDNATPLHLAALKDAKDCCSLLVDKGAAMDDRDKYGNTPLLLAAKLGKFETLNFFIKRGVSLMDTMESTGDSALHLVSRSGHTDCCNLILKSGKKSVEIVNKMDKTPLDLAFECKHDKIFDSILMTRSEPKEDERINPNYTKDIQETLHKYMHQSLRENRRNIVYSLVTSNLWFACFNPSLCNSGIFCSNFNLLIESYPDLAIIVFDKCSDRENRKYNFELFEIQFFSNADAKAKSSYPFNHGPDHQLLKTAKEKRSCDWLADHPLRRAINSQHLPLLQHPLTNAYLKFKWTTYINNIFFFLLLFEFLSLLNFSLNIGFSRNYKHMNYTNTSEDICPIVENVSFSESEILRRNIISAIQIIFCLYQIILETQFWIRMKKSYITLTPVITTTKICRCIGMIIFCIPFYFCSFDLGLKTNWQWLIGILTLLMHWFLFIHQLNQLPVISVFMPVTRKFALSYAKVLLYIFLILFMFAYSFHLLLNNQQPFKNIPSSFIKSIVWMLGDLNYDATFVELQNLNHYPIMTKLLFLFFVTSISFFIINMVITNPSEQLDIFRDRANVHKASSRIMLFLKLDSVFVGKRRRYARSFWVDDQAKNTKAKFILNFTAQIDSKEGEKGRSKELQLLELVKSQSQLLAHLNEGMNFAEIEQEKFRKSFAALNEKVDFIIEKSKNTN